MLCSFIKTDPRPDLLMRALCHDMEELYTGDIPFTTKRGVAGMDALLEQAEQTCRDENLFDLPRITEAEKVVLKLADMLEGLRWTAIYEHGAKVVCGRWSAAIWDLLHHIESMDALNAEEAERANALFLKFLPTN